MSSRIVFFRNDNNRFFVISKDNTPVEIYCPKAPDKTHILSIAKFCPRKRGKHMSDICFENHNAKTVFQMSIENFVRRKNLDLVEELSLFD